MAKIYIENFGPITKFEAEVKDIMLFIGPQATGKSTISKLIYYFKSIKEELINLIVDSNKNSEPLSSSLFTSKLHKKFLTCFGRTVDSHSFKIRYCYDDQEEKYLDISVTSSWLYALNIKPSLLFNEQLEKILNEVKTFDQALVNRTNLSLGDRLKQETERLAYLNIVRDYINELFEDNKTLIFIPAARSLLSVLSNTINNKK